MTCKNSYFKLIKETLKHHIASVFISSVVFFIQFIVFFLDVQSYTNSRSELDKIYALERLFRITSPNGAYVIPVVIVAIVLAYDFFRYMHSKKQLDFYESLPFKKRDWFILRTICSLVVFIVPYMLCTLMESILLIALGAHQIVFFTNLLWNAVCMILIFLFTWITAVLAMVMTGHPITAFCGFCIFNGYAPILLRYIYPVYAEEYFRTYVMDNSKLFYLEYISPIGSAIHLMNSRYADWTASSHIKDFAIILVLIILVSVITYTLFMKRPSEAANRAMAFEKVNPVIRILLVIPLTLYIGIYLKQIASYGNTLWMIFGFVIGTFLLHGIIESIFQFDIRGLWSHKIQMICCFVATIAISCIFWFDIFQYDAYTPNLEQIESINIDFDRDNSNASVQDGISGEYLDEALILAENLVEQDNQTFSTDSSSNIEGVRFTYHMKNGSVKQRYYRMDFSCNQELVDKLYATKEYKNDICEVYNVDLSTVSYLCWNDSISSIPLYMSEAQMHLLFETYMAEFTPFTYSQVRSDASIGSFQLQFGDDEYSRQYPCYVYKDFTETIRLLNEYMLSQPELSKYGNISESILTKYQIRELEIYHEEQMLTTTDSEVISSFKEHLVLNEKFYEKYHDYDWEDYYDVGVSLNTNTGISYTSAVIERDIADKLIKEHNLR